MPAPDAIRQIALDVQAGRPRRAKVRTLMGYFGLKRRRESGLSAIRAELSSLGISTVPDFETIDFDDQVRFVLIGHESEAKEVEELAEEPSLFALEETTTVNGNPRFRALLQTYDAYERFLGFLVKERVARVLQKGQNARREDRDRYPFFVSLEVGESTESGSVEQWLIEATRLGDNQDLPSVPIEETTPVAKDETSSALKAHVSDLHEAMRAELSRQIAELKEAMERKVEEIRIEAIRQLAKELNDEEALKVIQEFDSEMREKLLQKDSELKEAFNEVALLSAQIADFEEQLAERDSFDPSDAYPTMTATVQLFADIATGTPIEVSENAIRSASRSASRRRREVFQFLLSLREYAILSLGANPQKVKPGTWFESRGFDYAQGDSESTRNKHGKEREIQIDGERIQLEEHVTLFPNSPNCVSIYWYRDDATRRIVLGYVGPHLRTTSW